MVTRLTDESQAAGEKFIQKMDRDIEEMEQELNRTDDLVPQVLRFHLLCEDKLDRLISAWLPRGKQLLKKLNLGYFQKLELVNSFKYIPDELISVLRNLNSVRNKCAHSRDTTLCLADIDSIGRPLGPIYKKLKHSKPLDLKSLVIDTFKKIYCLLIGKVNRLEVIGLRGIDGRD